MFSFIQNVAARIDRATGLMIIGLLLALSFSNTSLVADEFNFDNSLSQAPTTATNYRILPRPVSEHQGKHLPHSTTYHPTEKPQYETHSVQPYTYGWFGPRSSPQWSRHFGYQRRYTQWSLK